MSVLTLTTPRQRLVIGLLLLLVAIGGLLGLLGITNPRRRVEAAQCAGGPLAGHPEEGARQSPCDWHDHSRSKIAEGAA